MNHIISCDDADASDRQHLKHALELATKAQDNHLRALVLALIAAHYLHTAGDHARNMLQTCEQLAAGLGAPPVKGATTGGENGKAAAPVVVGNAPLGLWVGERFLGEHVYPLSCSLVFISSAQNCSSASAKTQGRRSKRQ